MRPSSKAEFTLVMIVSDFPEPGSPVRIVIAMSYVASWGQELTEQVSMTQWCSPRTNCRVVTYEIMCQRGKGYSL